MKQKNIEGKIPDFRLHLKAKQEQFYQYKAEDKTQSASMSFKIKSSTYPTDEALLKSIDPSQAQPLLYKRNPFDIYLTTVPTPTHINFVFESRAQTKRVFDIVFNLKGLKLEEPTDDNKWLVEVQAGQQVVRVLKRTEEKATDRKSVV